MSEKRVEKTELDLSDIQRAHDKFYENNFFDVQIHCKSMILPAHRYILSTRSELLAGKLASGVDRLYWDEFEDRTSITLLRWIYTNEVNVSTAEQWLDLLHGSQKLQLVSLFVICERKLVSSVVEKPTRRFYEMAKKVGAYQLWEKCLELGLNALAESTDEIRDDRFCSSCGSQLSISVENKREEDPLQFNKLTMGCQEFNKFSDVEVVTSSGDWKAHAHVIKSRSEKLLKECRKDGGDSQLLNEREVLQWVYTDSVVINHSRQKLHNTLELMDTAQFYNLTPLVERCMRAIAGDIDIASCAHFHDIAEGWEFVALLKFCNQLISRYYVKFSDCSEVTAETEFQNSPSETLVCELPPKELAAEATEGLLSLNDDCLLHLFRFVSLVDLASIKGTCKRLSTLADQCFRLYADKSLKIDEESMFGDIWILKHFGKSIESLSVDSIYERYATQDDIFQMIAQHTGDKLEAISLRDCSRTEGETFEALKTVLKNVHRIKLGIFHYDSNYDTLLNLCENLKEVEIASDELKLKSDWYLRNPNITKITMNDLVDAEILKEICRNCSRLECLSVFRIEKGSDELVNLSALSSTLKQLEIHAGSLLIEDELKQFSDKTVLTELTLVTVHMTESLVNVLGEFPNLSNLSFRDELDFDEILCDTFSKRLTNINSLNFDCDGITFEVIANMIENLLDLKKLKLRIYSFPYIGKSAYLSLRKIRNLVILVKPYVYERACELLANDWLDNIQVKPFD